MKKFLVTLYTPHRTIFDTVYETSKKNIVAWYEDMYSFTTIERLVIKEVN